MDDQDRRVEVLREPVRGPALIHGRIGPWCSFKLPLRKPELFSRAVHALEVVDAVVRDEHLEAEARIVVVSQNPVDHVAAETRARGADAIAINVRAAVQHVGDAIHDVDISLAAPVAGDLVYKLLSVAG